MLALYLAAKRKIFLKIEIFLTVLWTACPSASTLYVLCYCCMRCRTVEGTASDDYINIQPSDSSIQPSEGRLSLDFAKEMTKFVSFSKTFYSVGYKKFLFYT